MAGFPLSSISQTVTVSGSSGAFSVSEFSKISIVGNLSSYSGTGGIVLFLEIQQEDGTWIDPYTSPDNFFTGNTAQVIPLVERDAPYSAARISWNLPAGATATFDISVFGIA
jgi:hypothetical protein